MVGFRCGGKGVGDVGSGVDGGSDNAEEVGGVVKESGFRGDDRGVFG